MRAKQSLGQNFLMHARTAERIAEAAQIKNTDTVLEIGPGTGMLTGPLLTLAKKVIAVETDQELVPVLKEKFATEAEEGRLEILLQDIRTFDPSSIKGEYKLVANIPYYITGEIIRTFLSGTHKPSSMTILVQKEVAVRIARDKKGSLLQMSVRAYGTPVYEFTVPRGAFKPAPNVDSAVLSIRDITSSAFATPAEEERFFAILHAGFAHKRKQLAKNLEEVSSKESIDSAFLELGLIPTIRAENLTIDAWKKLSQILSS
jgi:16S rRNA (adenine1518-N6/adenine1519-N6)-dimethyltransferase